jgi:hypothetical protein
MTEIENMTMAVLTYIKRNRPDAMFDERLAEVITSAFSAGIKYAKGFDTVEKQTQ